MYIISWQILSIWHVESSKSRTTIRNYLYVHPSKKIIASTYMSYSVFPICDCIISNNGYTGLGAPLKKQMVYLWVKLSKVEVANNFNK